MVIDTIYIALRYTVQACTVKMAEYNMVNRIFFKKLCQLIFSPLLIKRGDSEEEQ